MINEKSGSSPGRAHIEIKPADGSVPEILPNIAQYVVVAIPENDPEHNSKAFVCMGAERIAMVGIWLIQVSKALQSNQPIPPLGEFERKNPDSPIITPGRMTKRNSNILKPGLN
jgi:hypothetical protein